MVGAMLVRHPTNLPERFLDPLGQRLKRLAETDGGGFDIRRGEHEVIDQVRKGFPSNRHAQILHMRKIGLSSFSRGMDLLKHDLLLWAMQELPFGNMPT